MDLFFKLQELSKRISQLEKEKEEMAEEMGKKVAEAMELRQDAEEKSRLLAEKASEIDALLIQLND
jgi:regulator of replication initiation timing